jgi:HK97 family phage major capsid protein
VTPQNALPVVMTRISQTGGAAGRRRLKMKMKDLLERRTRIIADMRSITETPTGDGGDLSNEQATKFDTMKADLQTLEKSIDRQRLIDEAERRMNGEHVAGTGDNRFDVELRDFSLRRAILSQVPGHSEDCGRERELSAEIVRRAGRPFAGVALPYSVLHRPIEKRVVTSESNTSTAGGGELIATDLMSGMYIDALRSALVIRGLGATILTGLVGNIDIPKLNTSATVGWVAENTALTPSDQDFASVQLRPKHVGGIVEFSRNMLLQSSPAIEDLIRADFAAVIARAVDASALVGGGANEPTGITTTSGVDNSVSFAAPSHENVMELIEVVESANSAGTAFCTNAQVVRVLRSTQRVVSTDSVMIQEAPRQLAGYPLAQTSLCPSQTIIFGNWNDLLMGFWSELDVLVNPYESTAYSKGNVQVRAMATCDIALRHSESFAYSNDVAVTA